LYFILKLRVFYNIYKRKNGQKVGKKHPRLSIAPVGTASFLDFAPLNGLMIGAKSKKIQWTTGTDFQKSLVFTAPNYDHVANLSLLF
jgi:hypothetical protein